MRTTLALSLAVVAVGCSAQTTKLSNPAIQPTSRASTSVELLPITVAGLEKAIEENRGKVVLVDCWFLACGPCRKKFPQIVELHQKYAERGLVVMSLDVMPDDWAEREEVQKFLHEKGATFANFVFQDDQAKIDAFLARNDAEFTPSILLYGPNGGRLPVKSRAPLDEVETAIQAALK